MFVVSLEIGVIKFAECLFVILPIIFESRKVKFLDLFMIP